MQTVISIERKTMKKQKSATMYPKKQPTYIVAFAVNENMKKLSTEELKPKKSSLRNDVTSFSPSTSTKTLTIKTSKQNMFATQINDSKTEVKENYGECAKEVPNTLDDILTYLKVSKITSQPQVIFIAQKHKQKSKLHADNKGRKSKKGKGVLTIKNIHFKNQRARIMSTKLKRYCRKVKKNINSSRKIHKEFDSDSISKKVSRTRVLKKVLAKENFLADTEINIHSSFTTSPFVDDSSFISISSQGTLTGENSPDSINSIIEASNQKVLTYKSNIIKVAVAQISNTPNLTRSSYSIIVPHRKKTDFKDSLTSYESAFSRTTMLTSKTLLEDTITSSSKNTMSDSGCSNNNISNETLIPPNTRSDISHDNYHINNSLLSHETECNILSNCTLTYNIAKKSQDYENLNDFKTSEVPDKELHTRKFFDACMTYNFYPNTTPGINSVPDLSNNNNVIIAENTKTTQQRQKFKSKEDERRWNTKNNFHANIFQKPFNLVNAKDNQKNLNLPNATQIKNTIFDTSRPPRKCSQEVTDYPTSFPELCDKLTIILEIAVKKLEQTLSEKVVNELRKSLYDIDKNIYSKPKFQEDATSERKTNDIKLEIPTESKLEIIPKNDAYLQCDIVKNEVIDKLILSFNEGHSKSCLQSSSSNFTRTLKKSKLIKDYFEILKNPLLSQYKEQELSKGDSVQISVEDSVEQQMPSYDWKKTLWKYPVSILRENMFVLTSVPAFLFVMFVVYSYIMLMIRMWGY